MELQEIRAIVEAILFVSGEAVKISDLAQVLNLTTMDMRMILEKLEKEYETEKRGFQVIFFDEFVQFRTRKEYGAYVEKILCPVQRQTLSQSAMETLVIIAYKQPITRTEVENIRGVKCESVMNTLVNKGLIHEVGRKDVIGKPILYGTTAEFLRHFGLKDIKELPGQGLLNISATLNTL